MWVAGAVKEAFPVAGCQGVGGAYDEFGPLTLVSAGGVVLRLYRLCLARVCNRVCCESFRRSVGSSSMLILTCDRALVFDVVSGFELRLLNCCSRTRLR